MKLDLRYGGSSCDEKELIAIIKSVKKSVETGNWQAGEQAKKMELEVSKQLGIKYGILTTSGSCAGLLALSALELPKGSEVIIPATTFPTIFNIILQCGLVPVVVDSKVGTYNLDPYEIGAAISPLTKAIICVHAVGNVVDLAKVRKICNKHNLALILDNCDGYGSKLNNLSVEKYADISFTSFHAAHIVSMGVGGGVFTNNKELSEKVRMYKDWGRQANTTSTDKKDLPKDYDPRFIYEKIGYNFQILELQAAMGRAQLRKAEKIKKARQKNFDYLYKHLSKFPDLIMPKWVEGADVCWFAFPISVKHERKYLVEYLEKMGIETRSMFAGNITKHPAYKDSKYRTVGNLEGANYILGHSFWIGVHPRMTQEDREYVVRVFHDFFASQRV